MSGILGTNSDRESGLLTAPAAAGGGFDSIQVFTSSGTWTKPSGITRVFVELAAGGGGGANHTEGGGGGG